MQLGISPLSIPNTPHVAKQLTNRWHILLFHHKMVYKRLYFQILANSSSNWCWQGRTTLQSMQFWLFSLAEVFATPITLVGKTHWWSATLYNVNLHWRLNILLLTLQRSSTETRFASILEEQTRQSSGTLHMAPYFLLKRIKYIPSPKYQLGCHIIPGATPVTRILVFQLGCCDDFSF